MPVRAFSSNYIIVLGLEVDNTFVECMLSSHESIAVKLGMCILAHLQQTTFENIVSKGEIVHENFHLSPQFCMNRDFSFKF